jgi:hypothetical protein
MSDEQESDVLVSNPADRYLVEMRDGTWRFMRRDENGSAYQPVSEETAREMLKTGFPVRLEKAEAQYQAAQDEATQRAHALAEMLQQRGFTPEGKQGPVRMQRMQVEGGEPTFSAYSLDMRGNERKGPLSLEEARYLSGTYPEGVQEVPEGEELVPLPQPQPAPGFDERKARALMAALRGGK